MKNKMRILAALLAAILFISGCSSTDSGATSTMTAATTKATTAKATTTATTKATTTATTAATTAAVSIPQTVLFEGDGVKITAKSLETKKGRNPELNILIENNSGEDLTFSARYTSINGCMVGSLFAANVADGKKVNDSITLYASDMEMYGIEEISDIELYFHIYFTETWKDYVDTPVIQIQTDSKATEKHSFDSTGFVVHDANGVKITALGINKKAMLGQSLIVYIENNTDHKITVQSRDQSVNGFMVDTTGSPEIAAGKCIIDEFTFLSSSLKENEIENIEEIEMHFEVFNSNDWMDNFETETVELVVNK